MSAEFKETGGGIEAFPLCWPPGKLRTPASRRTRAQFKKIVTSTQGDGTSAYTLKSNLALTIYGGLERLRPELALLGATNVVISTNLRIRMADGLPRSDQRDPEDPGVAVYFQLEGRMHCLACDKWDRIADNVAAVAAHIAAIRGQLRWGVADVATAFAGYRALPAMGRRIPWWETLGFKEPPDNFATVEAKYRALILSHHPDRGGNVSRAAEINAALDEAIREMKPTD